ncbi:hypothetical protein [Acidovorax sp.]|uniref:hypothetical protein n=1 Tax=Acidovorax sp. TaxID=1872122 RepID=UPI00391F6BF9
MVAEAQAAMLLGNDHAEEPALAQELPDLGRQVMRLVDLELVEHGVEGAHLPVQEGLLTGAQSIGATAQQRIEIRPAREQLAFEAHRAGLQRGLLVSPLAGKAF